MDFWNRVTNFLKLISNDTILNPPTIDADFILKKFPNLEEIPNIKIYHAQALWQIYRAHTELALEGINHSSLILFTRWKSEMIRHIRQVFYIARRDDKLDKFAVKWTEPTCQWIIFDPGGKEATFQSPS